jgi:hypothetical protein
MRAYFLLTFFIRWRRVGSTEVLRLLLKNADMIWHGFALSALRKYMKVRIPSSIIVRNSADEILDPKPSSF